MPHDPHLAASAANLFTFLAEVQALSVKEVVDISSYDTGDQRVIHIDAVPRHAAVTLAYRDVTEPTEGLVLSIGRVSLSVPPSLPEGLVDWVDGPFDDETKPPQLRAFGVSAEPDAPAPHRTDHPEVDEEFAVWFRTWQEWADQHRRDKAVRELYRTLWTIHQSLEAMAERFEAVLGVGLLTWSLGDDHCDVRRHLFTCPLVTDVNADTGEVTARIDPAAVGARIETDMLPTDRVPEAAYYREFESRAEDFAEHPLNEAAVAEMAKPISVLLDADGTYSSQSDRPQYAAHPQVTFSPSIIFRQRGKKSMVSMLETIAARIEETGEVPAGVVPLVDPDQVAPPLPDPKSGAVVHLDGEVFSPLPLNDVQEKILERISTSSQVLVQGPPGTGKTHTAAALISHLLAQGQRVLVTAHTDRALYEVRGKLPKSIQPLAVSVIGKSRSDLAELRTAVDTISRKVNDHDPRQTERDIDAAQQHIEALRRERAKLLANVHELRTTETIPQSVLGYEGTLASIGQQLASEQPDYGWVRDVVPSEGAPECPLSPDELDELWQLVQDDELNTDDAEAQQTQKYASWLMPPADFVHHVGELESARDRVKVVGAVPDGPVPESIRALSSAQRAEIRQAAQTVVKAESELTGSHAPWVQQAIHEVRRGETTLWRHRHTELGTLLGQVNQHLANMPPSGVQFSGEVGRLTRLADHLLPYVQRRRLRVAPDGAPRIGCFTPRVVKDCADLFAQVRVDGVPPTTPEQLVGVVAQGSAWQALDHADKLWPSGVDVPVEDTALERFSWHQAQYDALTKLIHFGDLLSQMDSWLEQLGVPKPGWVDPASFLRYADVVDALEAHDAVDAAATPMDDVISALDAVSPGLQMPPAVAAIHRAVANRDVQDYATASARCDHLAKVANKLHRRNELMGTLAAAAPTLAERLINDADNEALWAPRVKQIPDAWLWLRATQWLDALSPESINAAQADVRTIERQIHEQIERLAADRAWLCALATDRLTGSRQKHLNDYVDLVRRIGKGTGKHAPQLRRDARAKMELCRPAIPAWIMPLSRVAEQVRPEAEMFDVVIVDEASQAGTEATLLQYLAKRIVVIGDDKQVSPSAVGINHDDVRALARRHNIHPDSVSTWALPTRSLFDEAKARFTGGKLTLTEHRRCVPEIINFSNRIAYAPEGIRLEPVRQVGSSRLEPIKMVHVPGGFQHRSGSANRAEAEALVDQLIKCNADPAYDGKTFGVISLVGQRQAQYIHTLLQDRLPVEEWERRDLRCGDSAEFQGSERDVMFLSMVSGKEDGEKVSASMTKEQSVQRYNVAVSRAKDQVWVFHSITLAQITNSEDMRHQLLKYGYEVAGGTVDAGDLGVGLVSDKTRDDRFDSLFEQRVHNLVVEKGYVCQPQVKANQYRIDLVVIGELGRLAVECDGEYWHGPDRFADDLRRQRELERCGWQFFRVRESAFYLDRHAALDDLWALLDDVGIRPRSQWHDSVASQING